MKELEDFSEAADNVASKRTDLSIANGSLHSAEQDLSTKAAKAKDAIDGVVISSSSASASLRQSIAPAQAATEAVGLVPVAINQGGLTPAPAGASDPSTQTATL